MPSKRLTPSAPRSSQPAWRPTPKRPYAPRDAGITSVMMSAVRGKGNKAEIALRKALWRRGFRYRLQSRRLIGRPDIVLTCYRAAIFVDGDYWHGRALKEGGEAQLRQVIRGARFEWWRDKLSRNIARDDEVTRSLTADGWRVVRIWESDVRRDVEAIASRIATFLRDGK
jgi:DNA mismatch endonuclease (patch repair protein)